MNKEYLAAKMRMFPTKSELYLGKHFENGRFYGLSFRTQVVLHGFIADFYCEEKRIVVEIDGYSHIGRENYDKRRDEILLQHGIRTVRIEIFELRYFGIEYVLGKISRAIPGAKIDPPGAKIDYRTLPPLEPDESDIPEPEEPEDEDDTDEDI